MSYGLVNIIETKWWSKKDSTFKKVRLLDNINIAGSYNFQADSLKWSNISMRGYTRILKGLTTINLTASFTPYAMGENGQRINKFLWSEEKKLIRLLRAEMSINTRATVRRLRNLFSGEKDSPNVSSRNIGQSQNRREPESAWSLIDNFSINHDLRVLRQNDSGIDTLQISTNNISFRGEIPLSPKWRITVGNVGYNFVQKRVTYPDFRFYRDLHCWEMGMSWQPQRGTYSFYIRVKPSSLGFLNIPYNRNNVDGFGDF